MHLFCLLMPQNSESTLLLLHEHLFFNFLTLSLEQYFDFNTVTVENLDSYKHDVD